MKERRSLPTWLAFIVACAGLLALYAGPLATGFLNDDYFFLEEARTRPLLDSLSGLGPLGNYYRPLSRQLYFAVLSPLAGGNPLVFHLANFAVFAAALLLLADLLRVFLPRAGVMAGVMFFAVLPLQRVNLMWVSCSQDLLALAFALAALALHRRDRTRLASLAVLAAVASKESAWPLPLALFAWDMVVSRRDGRAALRRTAPALALTALWIGLALGVRAREPHAADLVFSPGQFVAAYAHMVQSFLGLDHPPGLLPGLLSRGPAVIPLLLAAALAVWVTRGQGGAPATDRDRRTLLVFAGIWMVSFGFVVGPIVHTWSSYYYTLAAVGAALLVGLAGTRIGRAGWLLLSLALLWWHAGATAPRAFAVADAAWGWTSHLTTFYFERAASLTSRLSAQMVELEPAPPPDTRFFFALLPPWAGFQMGNGALLRALYREPSIESYFYAQFSPATAAVHPCRFLYWDGVRIKPLYDDTASPFFRVGCDLLLLDRPDGAAHAFRRGLAEGEDPTDTHYWLGWAELWRGNRAAAEASWRAFGARDDSLAWWASVVKARRAVLERSDSLASRRHLMEAIRHGIGRPEAHAALGHLMKARGSRFGLLELKVAASLDARDWRSRRQLLLGLADARLDEPARRVLTELRDIYSEWSSDSAVVRAAGTIEASGAPGGVARFDGEIPAGGE